MKLFFVWKKLGFLINEFIILQESQVKEEYLENTLGFLQIFEGLFYEGRKELKNVEMLKVWYENGIKMKRKEDELWV